MDIQRIGRGQLLMEVALLFSKRSTCQRGKVGAVIAKEGRIIATGYNEAPKGVAHCSGKCDLTKSCKRTIHAERNAIFFAAKHGIETNGCELYVTSAPCYDCAQAIIQAGLTKVVFLEEYRCNDGILLLNEVGIKTYKWNIRTSKSSQVGMI